MSHPDASFWDERYTSDEKWHGHRPPRALLTSHSHLLPRHGLALDAASGTGSTGIHLARHGWHVLALDVSNTALRIAQSRVRKEALPVSFTVMDLMADPWLPPDRFDLILNFYFLSRPLMKTYRKSLRPGGLLFFETFLRDRNTKVTCGRPHHYLETLELKNTFNDWEVIHYAETRQNKGTTEARRIAQLVARKPV
jgi:SAM-dependent methyltransferase